LLENGRERTRVRVRPWTLIRALVKGAPLERRCGRGLVTTPGAVAGPRERPDPGTPVRPRHARAGEHERLPRLRPYEKSGGPREVGRPGAARRNAFCDRPQMSGSWEAESTYWNRLR